MQLVNKSKWTQGSEHLAHWWALSFSFPRPSLRGYHQFKSVYVFLREILFWKKSKIIYGEFQMQRKCVTKAEKIYISEKDCDRLDKINQ